MKRYVKELYNDLLNEILKLSSERNKEYLESRLQMDKIVSMCSNGYLLSREAASALLCEFDKVRYDF